MTDNKNKTDDFFNLLEKDQAVNDPFATQEIAFKDVSGKLKVLKDGQVLDLPGIVQAGIEESAKSEEAQGLSMPAKSSTPSLPASSEIDQIIEKSGIKFNDKLIEKRFINLVNSILKGARNRIQVREVFISPMESGGMGFDGKMADKILKIIKDKSVAADDAFRDGMTAGAKNDLQQEMNELLKSPTRQKQAEVKPSVYRQDLIPKDKSGQEEFEIKNSKLKIKQSVPAKVPPYASDSAKATTDKKASADRSEDESMSKPDSQPKVEQQIMPKSITGPDPDKPTIQDIIFEPKLTGPIEEIRTMSLKDFRKLSASPVQVIHKILDKINLLEEESFTSKTLGIKAWQESIVNRQYLELGDASMETKKSIADIIAEKKSAGEDVLSEEEIEAIIELNKLLRY